MKIVLPRRFLIRLFSTSSVKRIENVLSYRFGSPLTILDVIVQVSSLPFVEAKEMAIGRVPDPSFRSHLQPRCKIFSYFAQDKEFFTSFQVSRSNLLRHTSCFHQVGNGRTTGHRIRVMQQPVYLSQRTIL